MSKGFTKDDAVDEPIVVPPRAPLPDGTINYVTRRGLAMLEQELRDLQRDKARAEVEAAAGDDDATRRATVLAPVDRPEDRDGDQHLDRDGEGLRPAHG